MIYRNTIQFLVRAGDRRAPDHPRYEYEWRSGQIVHWRPGGWHDLHPAKNTGKINIVVEFPYDILGRMGVSDIKDLKRAPLQYLDFKKFISRSLDGEHWKYFNEGIKQKKKVRNREYFFDFKDWLDQGLITQTDYENIFNHDHKTYLYIDRDFTALLKRYDYDTVNTPHFKNQTYTSGLVTVGTGQDESSWEDAISKIDDLTGNLTLQGNTTEEITISNDMTISIDTDSYTLTLNAHADHKHSGGAYGTGHRIAYTSYDDLYIDETDADTLNGLVIQDLAFDISGAGNTAINVYDGFDSSPIIIERNVIKGDSSSYNGIALSYSCERAIARNNIVYGCTVNSDSKGFGIFGDNEYTITKWEFYNNTCIKNYHGIGHDRDSAGDTEIIGKNNLCAENSGDDYVNSGDWDTTSKNVSSDATSPDGATYQGWDYSVSGCFTDYNNNDFRLDATDSTLDDGDDLSAIGSPEQFSDDIEDQSRSTWFIGASEYVSGGGGDPEAGLIGGKLINGGLLTGRRLV